MVWQTTEPIREVKNETLKTQNRRQSMNRFYSWFATSLPPELKYYINKELSMPHRGDKRFATKYKLTVQGLNRAGKRWLFINIPNEKTHTRCRLT